jgi:hypothetical protein
MAGQPVKFPPNTVWLGGSRTEVNDLSASESITPGMLVERFSSSGTPKFRKHATAGGNTAAAVATDATMLNKGVDDAYAANDLIEVSIGNKGCTFWMLIASGQNIAAGGKLESAGNGKLRALAAGTALFTALEDKDNSAGPSDARIRVEVL